MRRLRPGFLQETPDLTHEVERQGQELERDLLLAGQFARVRLVESFGTIEWPGGVDLDPDSLYERVRAGASG